MEGKFTEYIESKGCQGSKVIGENGNGDVYDSECLAIKTCKKTDEYAKKMRMLPWSYGYNYAS